MTGARPMRRWHQTWLTSVPADWKTGSLRQFVDFTTGWTPPTNDDEAYVGEYPWANISDLGPRWLESTAKHLSAAAVAGQRPSERGDLLFAFKLSVGAVSRVAASVYTNEAIATFRQSAALDMGYAFYALPVFLPRNAGTNIYSAELLNSRLIRSAPFACPPLDEQRAIADNLDRETARIDELIAKQERLIHTLRERRTSAIADAIDRVGDAPAVPLKRVLGYQEGPGIMAEDFRDEGVPLLRVRSVRNAVATAEGCNYLDPASVAKRWSHFRVAEGDLLISASASMGTVSRVPPALAGSIPYTGIIRLVPDRMVADFARWFVVSPQFSSQIDRLKAGSTIQHFGPTHLAQVSVRLPPVERQREIAAELDERTAQIDTLIAKTERFIALSRERRSALITAVVTGQVDVREAA